MAVPETPGGWPLDTLPTGELPPLPWEPPPPLVALVESSQAPLGPTSPPPETTFAVHPLAATAARNAAWARAKIEERWMAMGRGRATAVPHRTACFLA